MPPVRPAVLFIEATFVVLLRQNNLVFLVCRLCNTAQKTMSKCERISFVKVYWKSRVIESLTVQEDSREE